MKTTTVITLCAAAAAVLCAGTLASAAQAPPSPAPSPFPATLTLNQAQQIALGASPQLALARAVVDQSQASVGIARSGELPNVSGQATSDRSKSTVRTSGTTTAPFLFTSNSAAATVKQLIFDGGLVANQVQAASFSTDAAKLSLLRDVETVLLNVAQQYYGALQSRHQYEAAQKSLDVARVQVRLVEAQFHAGIASRADVLTAQLPVAQAELAVAQAQNGEASNVASMLATMGVPATLPVTLKDDSAVTQSQPNLDDLVRTALGKRTDYLSAQASVKQAQANVRSAQAGYFPVLGASASAGTASTSQRGTNYSSNWSLGASLSVPIFTSGLLSSQVHSARAQEQQAEANLKTSQLNVFLTVQQAYLALQTALKGLQAAKVELDQAQVVLNVTNAQYKSGVTTLPLLLSAQSGLTKGQSDYINALYSYKVAQQNLIYAEGTLTPQ